MKNHTSVSKDLNRTVLHEEHKTRMLMNMCVLVFLTPNLIITTLTQKEFAYAFTYELHLHTNIFSSNMVILYLMIGISNTVYYRLSK